ncbi:MAG: extracellular solute-binding protein [Actinomycetota bacterium]
MKRGRTFAVGTVVAMLAAGCSVKESPAPSGFPTSEAPLTGDLTFFAYEDAFEPALLDPFEAANPDVSVRTAAFSSADETITKLQSGFVADVVNVCVEDTGRMVASGLLQPIDTTRIANWDRMFPAFRELDGVAVDGQVYLVPMVGGTSGIMYNEDAIPDGVTSYADAFSEEFAGRIGLDDDPLTGVAVAAMALGIQDPLNLTEDQLAQVKAFLIEKKPLLRALFKGDSDVSQLFGAGEIDIAIPGYKGSTETLQGEGLPAAFSLASEGQLTWTCGYSIGANAANVDAAYALISHYSQPETQAWQAENFFYLVSNQDTLEAVSPEIVETAGLADPGSFQNAVPYAVPSNYDEWVAVWREFKSA